MRESFTISDLAAEFDVTTRTIRFYEEKGLLSPTRNGSTRIYTPADRVKLQLIVRGKRLGLTLEESGEIIAMYNPAHGNREQLQSLIHKIRAKRSQLQQQRQDIEQTLLDLRAAEERCLDAIGNTATN